MSVCKTPCKHCDRSGLPILFTRYSAHWSADAHMQSAIQNCPPPGQMEKRPDGLNLRAAAVSARMLRAGFLYLVIERTGAPIAVEGYRVDPQGFLTLMNIDNPDLTPSKRPCEPDIRGANRSMVFIPDARSVKALHYRFYADALGKGAIQDLRAKGEHFKRMQAFDVAGWAKGNTSQPHVASGAEVGKVIEFAALKSETLQKASESWLFGLMGVSKEERGWWAEATYREAEDPEEHLVTGGSTLVIAAATYASVHGKRLKEIKRLLGEQNGAVAACFDALGVAQEIGHILQTESLPQYTLWLHQPAETYRPAVTNAWLQSTLGYATVLEQAVKESAERRYQGVKQSEVKRLNQVRQTQLAINKAQEVVAKARGRRDNVLAQVDLAYAKLIDRDKAQAALKPGPDKIQADQKAAAPLGKDHVAVLSGSGLKEAMDDYSTNLEDIEKSMSGSLLSRQLALALAGAALNDEGQKWLKTQGNQGDGPYARMIAMNVPKLSEAIENAVAKVVSEMPNAGGDFGKAVTDGIEKVAVHAGAASNYLDKAAGLAELLQVHNNGALSQLAAGTWAHNVMLLASVKALNGLTGLPMAAVERKMGGMLLRLSTLMVNKAARENMRLAALAEDRPQTLGMNAAAARRAAGETKKIFNEALDGTSNRGLKSLRGMKSARISGVAAVIDLTLAIVRGKHALTNNDAKTVANGVGGAMQAVGSFMNLRWSAYENTVLASMKERAARKGSQAIQANGKSMLSQGQMTLRGLRWTAFKFLGPAAMIGVVLEVSEMVAAFEKGNYGTFVAHGLGAVSAAASGVAAYAAVIAAVDGTLFGIKAALVMAFAGWAAAAFLGGAIVLSLIISEFWDGDDWKYWLRDCPLGVELDEASANALDIDAKREEYTSPEQTIQQFAEAMSAA